MSIQGKKNIKTILSSFLVGTLFGLGLGISGMTRPEKVFHFLDVFGQWDPSLLFVMVGAISVHAVTFQWIKNRYINKNKTPIFTSEWNIPTKSKITPALVIGSILFGMGWGLGGLCPGPVITSMASFDIRPFVFIVSMLFGMMAFNWLNKKMNIQR